MAPAIPAPSTLGQVPRCCSECSPAREPCSAGRPKGFPCGKGISLGHPQDAGKVVDVACGVSACSAFLEGWVVSALPSWVGGARGVNSVAFGEVGEGPTRSSSSGVWGVCCLHGALGRDKEKGGAAHLRHHSAHLRQPPCPPQLGFPVWAPCPHPSLRWFLSAHPGASSPPPRGSGLGHFG